MGDLQTLVERLMHERGASLTAYAAMLADRDDDAVRLMDDAIVAVLRRRRPPTDVDEADARVRMAMATTVAGRSPRRTWRASRGSRPAAGPDSAPHADGALRSPQDDRQDRVDDGSDVRTALRALPPRERACVVMRHHDELTLPQIARALHVEQHQVRRCLQDATARLSPLLGVVDPGPEPEVAELVNPRSRR
ncbi:sigma factor-like helix-turn-helix DNA-binding protein [Demequina capsici]|uniref:Sigma factor-like helix-turn-helix DNA-binding protein n=1 Tax=Demequina capsici TaxID=3075620 RepID=A0AA96JCZ7_9MICO|nr:sigma factor-like helix-turn-helix DNA-binding protein [Demequina sp. OYTSA14]WNM24164.1 sigma factor-like helix-turn-helix DNA-binding protein [Demequina sp. OYTSA14]